MRRAGARILAPLLAIFGIFACLGAVNASKEADGILGLLSARFETPQTLPTDWRNSLPELDGGRFALCGEVSANAEAPLFLREARVSLIKVAGDKSLLFLPGRISAGGFPGEGDTRGCIVDEKTAVELWGTKSPLGYSIECGGAKYEVAGVIKAARPLLLADAGDEKDFAFSCVLFRGGAEDPFPRQAFDIMLAGISKDMPLIGETGLLAPRMRFIALVPLLLFSLMAARRCLKALPWFSARPGYRFAALAAVAVFSVFILKMPNIITPEMLPAYWSDFSFWPKLIASMYDRVCAEWSVRGGISGLLICLELVVPVTSYSLLALIAFIAAGKSARRWISGSLFKVWRMKHYTN